MIVWVLSFVALVVGLFGAVDAAVTPWNHWERAGHNKPAWIVAQVLVLFPIANLAGVVAAVVYLTRVRPKLKAVADDLIL